MKPAMWGWIGGIVGGAIGLLGGVIGTYFSVKNTLGPRERAFVIKASAICWVFVTAFLVAMFLLPSPQRFLLWVPYAVLLPIGIRVWNKKQMRIRKEESGQG